MTPMHYYASKSLRALLLIFALAMPLASSAEDLRPKRWQAALYGGLYLNNGQAWSLEPSVAWHFHRYVGIALGVELTAQYNQPCRMTVINGYEAELADNQRDPAWVIFKPSVVFKSPDLWRRDDNYFRLWLQAEPGVSLACPFHNSLTYEIKEFQGAVGHTVDYRRFPNKDLRWFYWNARFSANIAVDRYVIGIGYYLSDLDYYSARRNVTLADGSKFRVPKKELSQSIFLSLGYKF